jgi:hypothetical protein
MVSDPDAPLARQFLVLAVLVAAFLYAPFIMLVLACVYAVWRPDGNSKAIFLVSACLLFCTLNASKVVDGDLINYVNVQNYLTGRPLLTLLHSGELIAMSPTYRSTELGFYGTQWVLAQLFDSASASLAIAATLAIYVPTFAAILLLARVKGWNDRLTILIALFAFFGAINFNNSTHLVRQYVSASIAFLGLVVLFNGWRLWAVVCAVVACSIHNGTTYVLLCFGVIAALFPYGRPFWSRPWGSALRVLCALGTLAGGCAALWLHELTGLFEVSDISIWRYLITATVFVVFLYFARAHKMDRSDYYLAGAFLVALCISGFFYVMGLQVMALRYFVYLEWLYAPMIATILCAVPRRNLVMYFGSRWLVCCTALCIFILHFYNSAWTYGPDSWRVLTLSAREAIEYIGT